MARPRPDVHPACHRAVKQLDAAINADGRADAEILREAGLSGHRFMRWRKGEASPRLDLLEAAANTLGYEVHLVYAGERWPNPGDVAPVPPGGGSNRSPGGDL